MIRSALAAASLLALVAALTGCGAATVVTLAGNIVNAAGTAAADASRNLPDEAGAAERRRGMTEHLAWVGAESGDPAAAYRLATLLTDRRDPSAVRWMCEAAREGHPGAQLQVGHWYNEDRRREDLWPFIDVTPDNRIAYLWYTNALQNGDQRAYMYRETLTDARVEGKPTAEQGAIAPACGDGIWQAAPRESIARDA